MYYYVLEQLAPRPAQRFRERLTDLATDLGIAGEMVMTSSLKSTDDLIDVGVRKGYTTMVAVGSDGHIGRVITALMRRPAESRPALGTIPTDRGSLVAAMLGIDGLRFALTTLKLRHLAYATLAEVEPNKFFLTQARLTAQRPTVFEITIDRARMEVPATSLTVTGDGYVEIRHRQRAATALVRGSAWLIGATVPDRTTSLLHGERIRIGSDSPLSVVHERETLAKTPVVFMIRRRALKIVVARANLALDES